MAKQAASPKKQPAPDEGHQLFRYGEAARYLGPSFTERWVKRQVLDHKTIKAIRLTDGTTVIPKAELDRFVDERMTRPASR